MEKTGNYYFVADVHLGLKVGDPAEREKRFVAFLERLEKGTRGLFLLGDIFDFWYEYKYVIPRGFTRVLGALARVTDRGIPVHFFPGNHDLWTFGYLEEELGIQGAQGRFVRPAGWKKFSVGTRSQNGNTLSEAGCCTICFTTVSCRGFSACCTPSGLCIGGDGLYVTGITELQGTFLKVWKRLRTGLQQLMKNPDYCITGHLRRCAAVFAGRRRMDCFGRLAFNGRQPGCRKGRYWGLWGTEQGKVEVVKASVMVHQD